MNRDDLLRGIVLAVEDIPSPDRQKVADELGYLSLDSRIDDRLRAPAAAISLAAQALADGREPLSALTDKEMTQ